MKRAVYCFFLFSLLQLFAGHADEFETLMGKDLGFWNYLKKREDLLVLEKFRALYQEKLPLLDQKGEALKIPPVVHFIWLGPRPFPPESVENVRMWMEKHSDWHFVFWTDRKERKAPCKGMERRLVEDFSFQFLKNEYASSKNWGEKSDILRYEILYQEGGLYADHDANCLHSFENLHAAFDLYCGLEAPHPPIAGQFLTCGNGVIGSGVGHPVIRETIRNIQDNWEKIGKEFRGEDGYTRTERVLHRTYTALTAAVKEKVAAEGKSDIVLPAAYLFAKGKMKSLYSKHFYANGWADEGAKQTFHFQHKAMNRIDHKISVLQLALVGSGVVQAALVAYIIIRRKYEKRS